MFNKFKKLIIGSLIVLFCLLPLSTHAVNTTTVGSSLAVLEITGLDADWHMDLEIDKLVVATTITAAQATKMKNARITRIVFIPSAANDRMILHDGGVDSAAYFDTGVVANTNDVRQKVYEVKRIINLVIDESDCTMDTAANCKVLVFLEY